MAGSRILIVRTSALGDVVHALPVLTALRRHLPESRIGWVVEEAMAPVLQGHPDLDELLAVRLRVWRRRPFAPASWLQAARFLDRLERFAPEIVLDLMGNHKAGVVGAVTLADRRIGLAPPWRREPSSAIWLSETVAARGAHAVDQMLSVLDGLGVPAEPPDFGPESLLTASAEPPPDLPAGPFAVVLPGAGWDNKAYPASWWGEVARQLAEDPGLPTLVAAGPGEQELSAAAEASAAGAARALPTLSLAALAALLRRARLVLGGDTGPLHLAHALGSAVCCVMGPTDPLRNGPYGAADRAVFKRLPCSFCHQRLEEPKACLLELLPERVVAHARQVIAATAAP